MVLPVQFRRTIRKLPDPATANDAAFGGFLHSSCNSIINPTQSLGAAPGKASVEVRDIPASIGQRLMWLKGFHEGRSNGLICPLLCRIEGALDLKTLQAAFALLVARHESLRTRFVWRDRSLRQLIITQPKVDFQSRDISDSGDPEAVLETLLAAELEAPIDPFVCAVRPRLWILDKDLHVLFVNLHHLITDTVSCGILHRELAAAYDQLLDGTKRLTPVGWQQSQFMAWQERQIKGAGFRRHRDYWRAHLRGAVPPRLPFTRPVRGRARRYETAIIQIPAEVTRRLRDLAAAQGTTLYVVVLSAYYVVLRQLTGQQDLTTSTLLANRTRPETESTVGFLANLIALRTSLEGAIDFTDVIRRANLIVMDAISHQEIPYHIASDGSTGAQAGRLDDVVFQMLSEQLDRTYGDAVQFRGMVPDLKGRFDFELAVMPSTDGLSAKLHWTADRLDSGWARQFIVCYASAVAKLADQPGVPTHTVLDDLPLPIS